MRNLAKQRFRWSFGTLQCMWKHKDALLNPKYGSSWLYRHAERLDLSGFLSADLAADGPDVHLDDRRRSDHGYLEHQKEYAHTPTNLNEVLFYYALFLAVDWFGAFAAFLMEKREEKRLLGWLFIQRFGYRQVMYWVMVKSVISAVRGAIVGWGKLERKATVPETSDAIPHQPCSVIKSV